MSTPLRAKLTLLHTSDLHLGEDALAARRLAGLQQVTAAATTLSVDLVLIAGDLFDGPHVSAEAVQAGLAALASLQQPAILVPGNHDHLGADSIYARTDPRSAGAHIYFAADPVGQEFLLHELGCSIWARGVEDHSPAFRPLEHYSRRDSPLWHIVVTHGHYVGASGEDGRSSRITAAELATLDADYVALGHWHRFADVSSAGVPAFYSGSPSEPGEPFPSANLVTLDPSAGVSVTRLRLHS